MPGMISRGAIEQVEQANAVADYREKKHRVFPSHRQDCDWLELLKGFGY